MSYYQLSQLGYRREVIVKDSMCIFKGQLKLDGILGGYILVSTYSNYQNPKGGGVLESQNPKCQNLPKFQFSGGGGGVLESQNPKYQDLPKFQIFFGGGEGVFWKVKTQSAKICLNFNWGGGCSGKSKPKTAKISLDFNLRGGLPKFQMGGGVFWKVKTQSVKICLNFNFFLVFWNQIPV